MRTLGDLQDLGGEDAGYEKQALPVVSEFSPLYATVSPEEMRACVRAVLTGDTSSALLRGKTPKWICFVCETALEAEAEGLAFLRSEPRERSAYPIIGLTDFTLLTMQSILMQDSAPENPAAVATKMNDLMLAVIESKEATPLLDYEWIFQDAVQFHVVQSRGMDPVWTLKRAAAHDLAFSAGARLPQILCHMAGLLADRGDFTAAIDVYRALLRFDPHRLDSHFSLGEDLASAGFLREAWEVRLNAERRWMKANPYPVFPWEMPPGCDGFVYLRNLERTRPEEGRWFVSIREALYTEAPGHLDSKRLLAEAVLDAHTIPLKQELP